MRESLGPQERIRRTKEFGDIYKNGFRFRGRYFTLVYLENSLSFSRLGVVASRKVGRAVKRNRAKRRIRDLFRRNKTCLPFAADVVVVARPETAEAPLAALREEFLFALRSLKRKRRPR
ncbi:MAG: ribonuclease P protein component [Candidatus Aminicenantes bacterium]|nr:ribonuclease P protein component [Candidatus Aminicenantes bacterium]